ncbi:Phosphatidylinositol 4-phosphate 5-kinase [Psidium guajava]|nr:Phosphatidylinositol 4-phosphate 5-kinase [Psidium guajava]
MSSCYCYVNDVMLETFDSVLYSLGFSRLEGHYAFQEQLDPNQINTKLETPLDRLFCTLLVSCSTGRVFLPP